MAFENRSPLLPSGFFVFLSTAILVWFGNGLDPWWPLLWFAPIPVLWFALRTSGLNIGLLAGLSWLVGSLTIWGYFHILGTPFLVWLAIFGLESLVFALSTLLFRALVLRGAVWSATLAFPATWVTCEYLVNLVSVHGTAGNLAYTQLKFLAFLQLASITGPWGMTFLLLLFSAALTIGLHLRAKAPKQALHVVIAALSVIAAVLILGEIRLALPRPQREVEVGLIASDSGIAPEGAETARLLNLYAARAEQLAARGAQVIVLPEKIGVVLDSQNETADSTFQSLANRSGATIVVGEVNVVSRAQYNQARIYTPNGPVLTYAKQHLLPPFESSLTAGKTLTVLPKTPGTWAVAICKDLDFTAPSRNYGHDGVGLLLVPAWDFNVDRSWHGHMAVMRGVEDGFSIIRSAKNGYLTVSDDRGRILGEARSDSAPFATLIAKIPVAHDATIYLAMGDWFAWLAMAILGVTLLQLIAGFKADYRPVADKPGVISAR
jgi:apolipoprotein N-acyltransferase